MTPADSPLTDRVLQVVARTFQVPRRSVGLESSPDTIATWDSLQHVHLILALEEEFGMQFAVDEIEALQSVAGIVAILRERFESLPHAG